MVQNMGICNALTQGRDTKGKKLITLGVIIV